MEITLDSPLDMHLHLRDGDMLKLVAPLSGDFAGAVIMPNLVPPVTEPGGMLAYNQRIREAMGNTPFSCYMTLFFTKQNEQQHTRGHHPTRGMIMHADGGKIVFRNAVAVHRNGRCRGVIGRRCERQCRHCRIAIFHTYSFHIRHTAISRCNAVICHGASARRGTHSDNSAPKSKLK